MKTGVLVVHGGEPSQVDRAKADQYLKSTARTYAILGRRLSDDTIEKTARDFASAQGQELIDQLQVIGGSPHLAQGGKQSRLLERSLRRRGLGIRTYSAAQHFGPPIEDTLVRMRADGIEQLLTLPVFPICSQTSAIAILDRVSAWLAAEEWTIPHREISDWHRHPDYYRMHADVIAMLAHTSALDLHATDTALVFAAEGAPTKFLRKGPPYLRYAQEIARGIAREVGRRRYEIGFLNAGPIGGKWTEPHLHRVVASLDCARVVVVPIDTTVDGLFTLWGLDHALASVAREKDMAFHRTPLPHATTRFSELLADLIEDLLRPEPIMGDLNLRRCLCRGTSTAFCLNAAS